MEGSVLERVRALPEKGLVCWDKGCYILKSPPLR